MKKILFFLFLWCFGTANAQFDNHDFENSNCPTQCSADLSLTCGNGWYPFSGYPQIINNLSGCNTLICEGSYALGIGYNSGYPGGSAATANPVFQESPNTVFNISLDFYVPTSSDLDGKLVIYGTNGAGALKMLGESSCTPKANVCNNISIILSPEAVQYSVLVFDVEKCSGGSHSAIGVIDNITVCKDPFELITTDDGCSQLCFEYVETACSNVQPKSDCVDTHAYPIVSINFSNGDVLDVVLNEAQVCIDLDPGVTYNYEEEYLFCSIDNDYTRDYILSNSFTTTAKPIVDYIIVDDEGNEKSTFCEGEAIFLKNTGTEHEIRWFLSMTRWELGEERNAGTWVNYYNNPWEPGEVPGMVNLLDDLWANANWDLWKGEYRVQLAGQNDCFNWVAMTADFTIDECSVEIINYTITEESCNYCFSPTVDKSDCVEEVKYFWTFENHGTSTDKNPCITLEDGEEIDVTLEVYGYYSTLPNAQSCSSDTYNSSITANCDPCICGIENSGIQTFSTPGCLAIGIPIEATTNACTEIVDYSWDWGDGTELVTLTAKPVSHYYNMPGEYLVCMTTTGRSTITGEECEETDCRTAVVFCGGPPSAPTDSDHFKTASFSSEKEISIHPNPAINTLYIENNVKDSYQDISIFSIDGREIIQTRMDTEAEINISDFKSGIYFIKFIDNQGNVTTDKFIKQ